jgi:hypothetical protein
MVWSVRLVPPDPLDLWVVRAQFPDPLDPPDPLDLSDLPVLLDRRERLAALVRPDNKVPKESKATRETRAIQVLRVLPEQLDLQSAL